MANGAISRTALGDPTGVRDALEAEGVLFVHGRADADARLLLSDLGVIVPEREPIDPSGDPQLERRTPRERRERSG
jgi:hypothetical protein